MRWAAASSDRARIGSNCKAEGCSKQTSVLKFPSKLHNLLLSKANLIPELCKREWIRVRVRRVSSVASNEKLTVVIEQRLVLTARRKTNLGTWRAVEFPSELDWITQLIMPSGLSKAMLIPLNVQAWIFSSSSHSSSERWSIDILTMWREATSADRKNIGSNCKKMECPKQSLSIWRANEVPYWFEIYYSKRCIQDSRGHPGSWYCASVSDFEQFAPEFKASSDRHPTCTKKCHHQGFEQRLVLPSRNKSVQSKAHYMTCNWNPLSNLK